MQSLPLFAILATITGLGFSRLLSQGLGDELFKYGRETLRAVQAWENHGLLAWAGFFPLGSSYIPASHTIASHEIYQSHSPLYLLIYWPAYHFFGEAGFQAFKLGWSLAYGIAMGILLGSIASSCLTRAQSGYRQLVFASAYVMTISNQAVLRYFMVDEPDYLGVLLLLFGVFLLMRRWQPATTPPQRPWLLQLVWFTGSWTYPILGTLITLSIYALQRLRLEDRIRASLRSVLPPLIAGIGLYWIQRMLANIAFPQGLTGSGLFGRMGLTSAINNSHKGVLSALHFMIWQQPGSLKETRLEPSLLLEHSAIWIIGVVLFAIVLTRLPNPLHQLALILAAAQLWLFIPFLHQSLAHHDWIYAIHFAPSVVLGWVGAFAFLAPQQTGDVFPHWMLGFVATLIWAVQMRFFLVAYLG
jgi:hypothetical protein